LEIWIEINEITKTQNDIARSLDIHHKYSDCLKTIAMISKQPDNITELLPCQMGSKRVVNTSYEVGKLLLPEDVG
jgi:hypothetical protein